MDKHDQMALYIRASTLLGDAIEMFLTWGLSTNTLCQLLRDWIRHIENLEDQK